MHLWNSLLSRLPEGSLAVWPPLILTFGFLFQLSLYHYFLLYTQINLAFALACWGSLCSTYGVLQGCAPCKETSLWICSLKQNEANLCVFTDPGVWLGGINFCEWDAPNCAWAVKQYSWVHWAEVWRGTH